MGKYFNRSKQGELFPVTVIKIDINDIFSIKGLLYI